MSDNEKKTPDTDTPATGADQAQAQQQTPADDQTGTQGPGFVMQPGDNPAPERAEKSNAKKRSRAQTADDTETASSTAEPARPAVDKSEAEVADDPARLPPAEPVSEADNTGEKTGKAPLLIAACALLIALGTAAAGGYSLWQQQEKTDQQLLKLNEYNRILEARLQQQSQGLNQLQGLSVRTGELQQQSQTLQQQQAQQQQNLQDLAAAFAKTQGPKPSDWLQAEAEYLLRLANHRLQLEGDLTGARTLLASADERLAKADNPALFAVRQAIANELAALNGTPALDRSGLYFKLSALEGRIDQLPLPMDPANRSALQYGQSTPEGEQNLWQTLWNEAKTLVVVRHRDEKITPLLPPQESLYLRHNLRLTLQQAQIALLKEQQTLFQTLIAQASDWVQSHFDPNAPQTQAALATLTELSGHNIRQRRPDISGSLNLLRNLQQQRFSSAPATDATEPERPATETEAPQS